MMRTDVSGRWWRRCEAIVRLRRKCPRPKVVVRVEEQSDGAHLISAPPGCGDGADVVSADGGEIAPAGRHVDARDALATRPLKERLQPMTHPLVHRRLSAAGLAGTAADLIGGSAVLILVTGRDVGRTCQRSSSDRE